MCFLVGGGSYAAKMIWSIGTPLVLTLGVVGNIMTLIVLLHRETKKTPTTIFLTVLACSDLLNLIVLAPRWTLIYLFKIDVRHFGNFMCKLHWYLVYCAPNLSVWFLVAMTLERLAVTIQPHKARHYFTKKLAIKMIAVITVGILIWHTHILYGFSLKEVPLPVKSGLNSTAVGCDDNSTAVQNTICFSTTDNSSTQPIQTMEVCWIFNAGYLDFYQRIQVWTHSISYLFIPAIVFIVSGFYIVTKVVQMRRKSRTNKSTSTTKGNNIASQITMTVLLVNGTFIVCATPVFVFMMGIEKWVDPVNGMTPLQEVVWAIGNELFFLNHAINFLLYFLSGQKFREQWLHIFTCKKRREEKQEEKVTKDSPRELSIF